MRASSNNYYQKSLPFTDIPIHSNKFSEDETGYDSLPRQPRMNSTAGLSSSSFSSNNEVDDIVAMVKDMPSPTDVSITYDTFATALSVAQRVAQFSEHTHSNIATSTRKVHRTRVQPIPDSTSDSADSFALSNGAGLIPSYRQHIPAIASIELPPFGGNLAYIHDDRFDSNTTVEHLKNDVVAVELMEQRTNPIVDTWPSNKQSGIERLGESIRLLPANVLAVVFIGLVGGLLVSVILVIIVA